MEVLRTWLCAPVPAVEVAYSNDLVRLRTNFIAALAPAEQADFVDDALRTLRELEAEYERTIEERGEASKPIAVVGILYETRARIAWLEYVKTVLPISRPSTDEN